MKFRLDEVSSQTGQNVDTAVCRWRREPPLASHSLDCLAGVDASGNLILFEGAAAVRWQSWNLSRTVNRQFSRVQPVHARTSRPVVNRSGKDDDEAACVDVLVLPDATGHLVLCQHEQSTSWVLTDISADCDVIIDGACRPVIWETHEASATSLHILAVGADGALLEFIRLTGQAWHYRSTGAHCTPGSLSLSVEEAAIGNASPKSQTVAFSISAEGLLYRHVRLCPPGIGWRHEPVSSIDSPRVRPHSTATLVIDGQCLVAACDVFGSVLVFQPPIDDSSGQEWIKTDVTAQTGCRVRAVGAAMVLRDVPVPGHTLDDVGGPGHSSTIAVLTAYGHGRAYRFWWNAREEWQVTDVEEALGLGTRLSAHPGVPEVNDESIALVTSQRLILCYGLESHRSMTRRLVDGGSNDGCPVFSRRRSFLCRVVATHDGQGPVPELRAIGEAVFGSRSVQRNATSYLDYVSGGAFTLQRDDVVGWLSNAESVDSVVTETGDTIAASSTDKPLTSERARQRVQQAIHSEPSKGWETATEKGLQGSDVESGSASRLTIAAYHGSVPARGDARHCVQWPVKDSISVIRLVQEILRSYAQLSSLSGEASDYDLMVLEPDSPDQSRFLHPNGAWKLLMGWVRPRLVTRSMRCRLKSVSDSREVIVLVRGASCPIEYFVIENRQCRPMDDVIEPGLLVWHVLKRSEVASRELDENDAGCGWQVSLASAVTAAVSSIERLDWADGRASGYTLNNVSPVADVMSFDLDVAIAAEL